jgi:tricorn protease-like protein
MSNYFPRYSPDGRWIVFCRAKSFMLLQPDSEVYIIGADGGKARRLGCNTSRMNSWHSFSPNGKWLVFASKARSDYTHLCLTHIDDNGFSTPAVLLEHFTEPDRAANIPEFVNAAPESIVAIHERFLDP